jgi:hypothetical protein
MKVPGPDRDTKPRASTKASIAPVSSADDSTDSAAYPTVPIPGTAVVNGITNKSTSSNTG